MNKIRIPAIIILGAGHSQIEIIKKAKDLNYTVFSIDRDPNAIGFQYSDIIINESTHNFKNIILKLKKFHDEYIFLGLIARTTGKPLLTAAKIIKEFNLTGINEEIVSKTIKKSQTRNFCNVEKIQFPYGKLINSKNYNLEDIKFPVILKPDFSYLGKFDIFYCQNKNSLLKHLSQVIKNSYNDDVELESFIDGIDVTCLCWANFGTVKIITWWDELVGITNLDRILPIGISIPSVISESNSKSKVTFLVKKIVQYFSNVNSLILISFRIDMNGIPYLIEIHLDLGGDLIAEKLLPSANIQFEYFKLVIQIATNSLENVKHMKFEPTAMYYLSKRNSLKNMTSNYSNHQIVKNGSIDKNLEYLKETFILNNDLNLKVFPKHQEWLQKNKK